MQQIWPKYSILQSKPRLLIWKTYKSTARIFCVQVSTILHQRAAMLDLHFTLQPQWNDLSISLTYTNPKKMQVDCLAKFAHTSWFPASSKQWTRSQVVKCSSLSKAWLDVILWEDIMHSAGVISCRPEAWIEQAVVRISHVALLV